MMAHAVACATDTARDGEWAEGLVVDLHGGQFALLAPASDLGADMYDIVERMLEVFGGVR